MLRKFQTYLERGYKILHMNYAIQISLALSAIDGCINNDVKNLIPNCFKALAIAA